MDNFSITRRDPLLSEQVYKDKRINFYEKKINNPKRKSMIEDEDVNITRRASLNFSIFVEKLERVISDYSAGVATEDLDTIIQEPFDFYEDHKKKFHSDLLQWWEQNSYQYYLWLFSLAVMTGQPQKIPDLVRWYSPDPDSEGEDPLLGTLMSRLGIGMQNLPLAEELTFPKSYSALYEAIQGDETRPKEERQECLKRYLKHWYQGMKECYWYGDHKSKFSLHFGYWAFEAGLVTLLYDLDDSSYRDMKYYPKDLVDHAREQGYDKLLDQALMHGQKKHDIYRPGSHSPYAARWKSNLLDDEITLEKGQVLPGPERSEQNPSHLHFWISFRD